MYCVAFVFMMQPLKLMSVLAHSNLNQLNVSEKVVLDGASTKGRCSSSVRQHKIETLITQPDLLQRVTSMVEDI